MRNRPFFFLFASTVLSLAACGGSQPASTTSSTTTSGTSGTGGAGGAGGAGGGGGAPVIPLPEVEGPAPFADKDPDPSVLEVDLTARVQQVALLPGNTTKMFTYDDQLPGPLLHARVGDRVIVHFKNELTQPTIVHWHGLRISDQMDGSPVLSKPIEPGGTFTYDFTLPDAGTYWYHTHNKQIEQLERGLYGAIVVHEKDAPRFSKERIFVGDDIRLTASNQIAAFQTSGPDVGAGRVGNTLLVNGKVVSGDDGPLAVKIPRGAIERWRFVLATNALAYGLRMKGAKVRVIATDGGLLPEPFDLKRVEIAPGQRYDFEVRPDEGATQVVLEAVIKVLNDQNQVVDQPFTLVKATVEGEVSAEEPVYPSITHPPTDVAAAEELDWKLSGALVNGKVEFTINGKTGSATDPHDHLLLHSFAQDKPVKITLSSTVSPAHPFHIHGQFFQILARGGKPVTDEPGLRDTVHVRGDEPVTILSYFENPGRWMVHCHISEHAENGMMADIQVDPPGASHSH